MLNMPILCIVKEVYILQDGGPLFAPNCRSIEFSVLLCLFGLSTMNELYGAGVTIFFYTTLLLVAAGGIQPAIEHFHEICMIEYHQLLGPN